MEEVAQPPLRVLIVEDSPEDAELMIRELRHLHPVASWSRVASELEFRAGLESVPDIILSDYAVPGFGALSALNILRECGLDIPVLVITGSLGDIDAVDCIKLGAHDYLLKDRLARLPEAVRQSIEKKRLREASLVADKALRESERLNRAIIDSSIDSIITIDGNGKIIDFNPAAVRMFNIARREAIGAAVADHIIPLRYRAAHHQGIARLLATGESRILGKRVELTAQRAGGSEFPVEVTIAAIGSWDAPMFTAHIRDITERKSHEAKIARLSRIEAVRTSMNAAISRVTHGQQLYDEACRIAVEHGHFGMVWIGFYDRARHQVTPAAWAGYEIDDDWTSLKVTDSPTDSDVVSRAIRTQKPVVVKDITLELSSENIRGMKAIERGFRSVICLPLIVEREVAGTFKLFAREANAFNEEEVNLLVQISGEISRALENMTRRDRIAYLYHYDTLTGLPNRARFVERLTKCFEAKKGSMPSGAVAVLNLQRFRNVNETFGRQGGDHLLRLVARRMEGALGGMDCIARIEADTFAVLLEGLRDAENAMAALEELVLAPLREPFHLEGVELPVVLRIGLAAYPFDANDADLLIRNAEAALERARQAGERYLFYSAEMNARAAHALTLETRLRAAVEQGQFVLHYQPKVSLSTGEIVGVEALIRWNDPATGLVAPGDFIPILEETGLILETGRWALLKAREDYGAWKASGVEAPRIAVNVSQVQLRQRNFVDVVRAVTGGDPGETHGLDVEITESLIMDDVKGNIEKLQAIQQLGVRIALDDFGTGYSSLSYLARLPVDYLKIDRSFIITMVKDPNSMAIVSTILALAHSLKRKVVAEGVDSKEQAQLLKLLRCDEMQGYLFSKPVPAEALLGLLRSSTGASTGKAGSLVNWNATAIRS